MPYDSARSLSTLIALKVASEKSAITMLKEYHSSSATSQKSAKGENTPTGCTQQVQHKGLKRPNNEEVV